MNLQKELERTVYNGRSGYLSAPEPLLNILYRMKKEKTPLYAYADAKKNRLPFGPDGDYFLTVATDPDPILNTDAVSGNLCAQDTEAMLSEALNDTHCLGLAVNPWQDSFFLQRKLLIYLDSYGPKSFLSVVRASVLDIQAGCIVNAANSTLLGGGGVDGAIHNAAGTELLKECRSLGGCKTGEAKITGAYNLKNADRIIHTVGPIYSGVPEDRTLLAACYKNSLDLAKNHGEISIAFPGISTGVYGYPKPQAAEVALATTVQWMNEHPDTVMNVYFCCYREEEYQAYRAFGVC